MINVDGRQQLIEDLEKYSPHYNQMTFAEFTDEGPIPGNECGAVMCMAGLCYLRQVGWDKFLAELKYLDQDVFMRNCLKAGKAQLGLAANPEGARLVEEFNAVRTTIPQIFDSVEMWPIAFSRPYREASDRGDYAGMAEAAIVALKAMDADGKLQEDEHD